MKTEKRILQISGIALIIFVILHIAIFGLFLLPFFGFNISFFNIVGLQLSTNALFVILSVFKYAFYATLVLFILDFFFILYKADKLNKV